MQRRNMASELPPLFYPTACIRAMSARSRLCVQPAKVTSHTGQISPGPNDARKSQA